MEVKVIDARDVSGTLMCEMLKAGRSFSLCAQVLRLAGSRVDWSMLPSEAGVKIQRYLWSQVLGFENM